MIETQQSSLELRQTGHMAARGCLRFAFVIGTGVILLLILLPIAALLIGLNPITGEYRYDPRTSKPAVWLLATPPEERVLDYIRAQMTNGGSFPAGDPATVQSVEAIGARAAVYTDWQTPAEVTVQFSYSSNSSSNVTQTATFRLYSDSSRGMELGPFALSYYASFPALNVCEPMGQGSASAVAVAAFECRP